MMHPEGRKWKVYVAQLSLGTVSDNHGPLLRELEKRYGDEVELVYPESVSHRRWYDFARNSAVEDFLATDCDILWFLDSDVTPPNHILDLVSLHGARWQAAGAAYPVFMSVPGFEGRQLVFTAYRATPDGGMQATHVPYEGLAEVDGLATGCLFLKREVFAKLERPYFEFKFEPKSRELTEGEDIGFCRKLRDLGIPFLTDFSMVCKHDKQVDLLEINNYAIAMANQAVMAYEARIRAEIDARRSAAFAKKLSL